MTQTLLVSLKILMKQYFPCVKNRKVGLPFFYGIYSSSDGLFLCHNLPKGMLEKGLDICYGSLFLIKTVEVGMGSLHVLCSDYIMDDHSHSLSLIFRDNQEIMSRGPQVLDMEYREQD
jgi:hypothetical protein